MRAGDLLGRRVVDADGTPLGKIVDLLATVERDGPVVTGVLVGPRRRGRLLGYERPGVQGPWLIARIAERLHRGMRLIPYEQLDLSPGAPAPVRLRE